MYKVTIQNINQIYFSLQDHQGRRLALSKLEVRVFNGLTLEEANSYKKYIPLGLCVLIQEDEDFVEATYNIINSDDTDEVIDSIDEVEEVAEVDEVEVEEVASVQITLDELQSLKKNELRELCDKEGIKWNGKTKAELIELLVAHYGL